MVLISTHVAEGGLLTAIGSYGVCQSECNALVVACYAGAGYVFGTVTAGVGVPAAILGCNAALGTCQTACVATCIGMGFTPTP